MNELDHRWTVALASAEDGDWRGVLKLLWLTSERPDWVIDDLAVLVHPRDDNWTQADEIYLAYRQCRQRTKMGKEDCIGAVAEDFGLDGEDDNTVANVVAGRGGHGERQSHKNKTTSATKQFAAELRTRR
jgi:hypothetical protein